MTDLKPPRVGGDERATLTSLLRYQRESLVRKLTGVDDEAARHSPVPSGTSLLWLAEHMADAEDTWILRRFAGRTEPHPEPEGAEALERAVANYRAGWARVDAVVAATESLDELSRGDTGGEPVTLRWVLAHLLEETARHAGHADILREMIDGTVGR